MFNNILSGQLTVTVDIVATGKISKPPLCGTA